LEPIPSITPGRCTCCIRFKLAKICRVQNNLAKVAERDRLAGRSCLNQQIAQNRCFNWSCNDRAVACVGCKLIEQLVARSAAYYVNYVDAIAQNSFQRA